VPGLKSQHILKLVSEGFFSGIAFKKIGDDAQNTAISCAENKIYYREKNRLGKASLYLCIIFYFAFAIIGFAMLQTPGLQTVLPVAMENEAGNRNIQNGDYALHKAIVLLLFWVDVTSKM
jgi:hypothetical protein